MNLLQKQQIFAKLVAKLILDASDLGYGVTLGEAWRPPQMCQYYAEQGTGILHSNHEKRLAIDLNLFKNGHYLTAASEYKFLGEWWEAQSTSEYHCCWGGRFSKPDPDHFSFEDDGIK